MQTAGQLRNIPLVANARMYSSGANQAADAWTALLHWIVARVGGEWQVLDYPPPSPWTSCGPAPTSAAPSCADCPTPATRGV